MANSPECSATFGKFARIRLYILCIYPIYPFYISYISDVYILYIRSIYPIYPILRLNNRFLRFKNRLWSLNTLHWDLGTHEIHSFGAELGRRGSIWADTWSKRSVWGQGCFLDTSRTSGSHIKFKND